MILQPPAEWLLYLRKSVGYAGIARQRTTTTAYIEGMGGRIGPGDEYSDEDRTAYRDPLAPLPPRPKFDAMLAAMAARPGVGVAAWHADRLGRDPEAAETLIRACMRGGHLIATRSGGQYDVTTANGRDHLRGDIMRATHEVDHNTERLVEAKAEKAAAGLWLGGLRPFGWQAAGDGTLRLDATEAQLIAASAAAILAGTATIYAIRNRWNDAGVTGTGGGRWTTESVRRVLMRPRNAGLAEHHGQVLDGVTAAWPPIVSADQWRAVCVILGNPQRRTNLGGTTAAHLLTGWALCGGCGVSVVAGKSADGTPRYRCSRHVRGLPAHPGPHASRRIADADEFAAELVIARMQRDDAALLLRADHTAERGALLTAESAQKALRAEQWDLYRAKVITAAELTEGRAGIDAELARISARIADLDAADVLAPLLADPARLWPLMALGQQRAVVAALMYVTLMPGARYSRPPGWKQGDGQFDPRLVNIRWVRALPSDGG